MTNERNRPFRNRRQHNPDGGGAPDTTMGKDGDYAINTVVWEIYGPRSGGAGAGTPLRGNTRGGGGRAPLFGESRDSGGSGGRFHHRQPAPVGHGQVHPRKEGTRISAPSGNIIPGADNLTYQSNVNGWIVDSLFVLTQLSRLRLSTRCLPRVTTKASSFLRVAVLSLVRGHLEAGRRL